MKNFYPLFFISCLFFGSPFSFGQNFWTPLDGLRGVSGISQVVADDFGRLFILRNSTLYVSKNDGDTWENAMNGLPGLFTASFKFIKSPAGHLYLRKNTVYSTLYRYLSATNSWQVVAENNYDYDIDQANRIWAFYNLGQKANLRYTNDFGQSFQNINLNPAVASGRAFATFNSQHNLLAVDTSNGHLIYHFDLAGKTTKVLSGMALQFIGFSPKSGTAFYKNASEMKRSTDGGLTWENVDFPISQSTSISRMTFENNQRIWAHTNNGMYRSDDDGLTWELDAGFQSWRSHYFFLHQNDWFVCNPACVYPQFARTSDGGATWTELSQKFHEPSVFEILEDGKGNLFIHSCRQNSFETSSDGGKTWSDFYLVDSVKVVIRNLTIRNDGVWLAAGVNARLYRSLDGGATWSRFRLIDQWGFDDSGKFAVDPFGAFYFFSGFGTVRKSTDNGKTWKTLNAFFDYGNLSPTFHPNGDYFTYDVILQRYDAAADVTYEIPLDSNQILTPHLCSPAGTLFLGSPISGGTSGLFRMENGSTQMQPIPFFDGKRVNKMVKNSVGDLIAATDSTLFKSVDDGFSWSWLADFPNGRPLSLAFLSDQHIYLGYSNHAMYKSTELVSENNRILGKTWLDTNTNCQPDPTETAFSTTIITATGNQKHTVFAGQNGNFALAAPSGNYLMNVVPPSPLFKPCFSDVPVQLAGPADTAKIDLPLRAVEDCPYLSVNLATPILRRCFENKYAIVFKNEGTATAPDAKIEVTLDSLFEFVSATLPVFSQKGLVYTFNLGDLAAGQTGKFWIIIKVSCLANLGKWHCLTAKIFPETICQTELPNLTENFECRQNIGSFDPNDKTAFVGGIENPGMVSPGAEIEYFIRFQNTGTDTAFRVVVEDRLPASLDLTTLKPLVSSHPFLLELRGDRAVRFVFENILLPDSNINEAASHGFVKFRVSQNADLPLGTAIKNEADIFFDYNLPVRTNQSALVVGLVGTAQPQPKFEILAYPNPFSNALNFEIRTSSLPKNWTLRLFDILGRQVRVENCTGPKFILLRHNLQSGMYFFKIENDGQVLGSGRVLAN